MNPTDEQKLIIGCDLAPGESMKIVAFAGTGKTTTLAEYTKARPFVRFLYVAFNRSVADDARNKFPQNVTCKTSHALAFPRFGSKYKDRLVPGLKANQVLRALGLADYETAKGVIDTMLAYLSSSDQKIEKHHIPGHAAEAFKRLKKKPSLMVEQAQKLWDLMMNGENKEIGMLHDGYLKLFQLSNPVLPYDVVLMDEAQDINPVTADFLLRQQGVAKVIVGDSHQQIYAFRGAQDFIKDVAANKVFYLTQSFRFTQKIATAANMLLAYFKGEKKRIVGLRSLDPAEKSTGKKTIIARTNAKIFDEAVQLLQQKKSIGFVGDISGYRFDRIVDAYYLYTDQTFRIVDAFIKSFPSFGEMEHYAKNAEDREIGGICKVVLEYRSKIPVLIDEIKRAISQDPDVILTTAHKSKGLEWDTVKLTDDYADIFDGGELVRPVDMIPDEANLIYVAMTRGKKKVIPFPDFQLFAGKLYELAQENREQERAA